MLEPKTSLSVVYILSNPAMPGIVKIGMTSQDTPQTRVSQLYSTGVPVPFDIEYACRVPNPEQVERALHQAFGPQRINPRREFFEIEPEQAIAILRLLNVEEVTNDFIEFDSSDESVGPQDREANARLRYRRPNLNFEEMGIPSGSKLEAISTGEVAVVVSSRHVHFRQNEATSLTAATREALDLEHNVAPARHWTFNGKNLQAIYDQTYAH